MLENSTSSVNNINIDLDIDIDDSGHYQYRYRIDLKIRLSLSPAHPAPEVGLLPAALALVLAFPVAVPVSVNESCPVGTFSRFDGTLLACPSLCQPCRVRAGSEGRLLASLSWGPA